MIQKSHIWNSFLENNISSIQKFYICSDVSVDIISLFFNFRFSSRKSQSQQKLAKKITHFTNFNSLHIVENIIPQHYYSHFLQSQIFQQTCFWSVSGKTFALHLFCENCICKAFISERKYFFQDVGSFYLVVC